jgi:tRNA threonylcarbamoyladenosine biosynthesis protein TsaB
MTRLLTLDASLARASAALMVGDELRTTLHENGARVAPTALPVMAERLLREADGADAVAVVVGPGGFTGLRTAIALAEGIALALSVPLTGVTTGEALAAALPDDLRRTREVWAGVDTRRGRLVLERVPPGAWHAPAAPLAMTEGELPRPDRPVAAVGDAAPLIAARLLARGFDAVLTEARLPDAAAAARVATRRLRGEIPPRDAAPLYVEPPAVRAP